MDTRKLIGLRIKELRRERGISQEETAAQANIATNHLSSIELGKENPTLDTFLSLAAVFNVELKELFNFRHHVKKKELQRIIQDASKNAPEDQLRLLVKFLNTLSK